MQTAGEISNHALLRVSQGLGDLYDIITFDTSSIVDLYDVGYLLVLGLGFAAFPGHPGTTAEGASRSLAGLHTREPAHMLAMPSHPSSLASPNRPACYGWPHISFHGPCKTNITDPLQAGLLTDLHPFLVEDNVLAWNGVMPYFRDVSTGGARAFKGWGKKGMEPLLSMTISHKRGSMGRANVQGGC